MVVFNENFFDLNITDCYHKSFCRNKRRVSAGVSASVSAVVSDEFLRCFCTVAAPSAAQQRAV